MVPYLFPSTHFSALFAITSPSSLSDADAAHLNITASQKSDFMEEVTTELSVYLGMLYHMVEIFKGHDDFADELSESKQGFVPGSADHSFPQ